MAMGVGGRSRTTMAEINVTPLVDVMLVLLIIFMITAPMLQHELDVNLPVAAGTPQITAEDQVVLQQRRITFNVQALGHLMQIADRHALQIIDVRDRSLRSRRVCPPRLWHT